MWKPPVLVPSEKEESCELFGAGKRALAGAMPFPRQGVAPLLSPRRTEPGPGPASKHPSFSSEPGLLGTGWDIQVQLDLEPVTVCVNALGWTLEIQEPPCHIWVSPCRSCAHLPWMSLELVVACREPLGHGNYSHWCFLGPPRCRKGQDVLTSSTKGVLPSLERGLCVHACVTETQ